VQNFNLPMQLNKAELHGWSLVIQTGQLSEKTAQLGTAIGATVIGRFERFEISKFKEVRS
jgi:hypothetical protein